MPELDRRDFLKYATRALLSVSGLLGLGGLARFFYFQTEPPRQTVFDLGPASDYAVGTRTLLPDVPAMLIHDESGFSALSLVCTHLGCTVESETGELVCPCHGSLFDGQGQVVRGPASTPLPVFQVETTAEGNLQLFLT